MKFLYLKKLQIETNFQWMILAVVSATGTLVVAREARMPLKLWPLRLWFSLPVELSSQWGVGYYMVHRYKKFKVMNFMHSHLNYYVCARVHISWHTWALGPIRPSIAHTWRVFVWHVYVEFCSPFWGFSFCFIVVSLRCLAARIFSWLICLLRVLSSWNICVLIVFPTETMGLWSSIKSVATHMVFTVWWSETCVTCVYNFHHLHSYHWPTVLKRF